MQMREILSALFFATKAGAFDGEVVHASLQATDRQTMKSYFMRANLQGTHQGTSPGQFVGESYALNTIKHILLQFLVSSLALLFCYQILPGKAEPEGVAEPMHRCDYELVLLM